MSDPGEFREVESNHSGRLSHVSSELVMIPSSPSLLSRDRRLPLDTCNQSEFQEFNLTTCKETEKQSLKQEGRRLVSHK